MGNHETGHNASVVTSRTNNQENTLQHPRSLLALKVDKPVLLQERGHPSVHRAEAVVYETVSPTTCVVWRIKDHRMFLLNRKFLAELPQWEAQDIIIEIWAARMRDENVPHATVPPPPPAPLPLTCIKARDTRFPQTSPSAYRGDPPVRRGIDLPPDHLQQQRQSRRQLKLINYRDERKYTRALFMASLETCPPLGVKEERLGLNVAAEGEMSKSQKSEVTYRHGITRVKEARRMVSFPKEEVRILTRQIRYTHGWKIWGALGPLQWPFRI